MCVYGQFTDVLRIKKDGGGEECAYLELRRKSDGMHIQNGKVVVT